MTTRVPMKDYPIRVGYRVMVSNAYPYSPKCASGEARGRAEHITGKIDNSLWPAVQCLVSGVYVVFDGELLGGWFPPEAVRLATGDECVAVLPATAEHVAAREGIAEAKLRREPEPWEGP